MPTENVCTECYAPTDKKLPGSGGMCYWCAERIRVHGRKPEIKMVPCSKEEDDIWRYFGFGAPLDDVAHAAIEEVVNANVSTLKP